MTVDLGASTRRMLVLAAVVCGLLGAAALFAVFVTEAGRGFYTGIAVFFGVFAGFFTYGSTRFSGLGRLTVDGSGVSFAGREGEWSIGWEELDSAYTDTVIEAIPGAGSLSSPGVRVPCLELVPVDAEAGVAGHQEMSSWWVGDRWRVPVRSPGAALDKVARGVRRYRPRR